jgi:hypothetical protein
MRILSKCGPLSLQLVAMGVRLHTECKERRGLDRRRRRISVVLRERRSGFDRRTTVDSATIAGRAESMLRGLRDRPSALAIVLVVVNVLNVIDFFLTLNCLAMGGGEANPIMRRLFDADPLAAGVFKFLAIAAVTILMWRCRRFRSALQTAVLILAVFGAVFIYHIIGLTVLGWI